jgi:hypothetical protein
MTIGTSIVLIAIGAILKYAVTASVDFVDIQVVGTILMIVGILGLAISLLYTFVLADRRRDPRDPPPRFYAPLARPRGLRWTCTGARRNRAERAAGRAADR